MRSALTGSFRFTALTVSILALSGCGLFSSNEPGEKPTAFASSQSAMKDGLTLYEAIALNLRTHLDTRTDSAGMTPRIPDSPLAQSWTVLDRSIGDARITRTDDARTMEAIGRRKAAWAIIQETETAYRRAALAQDMQPAITAALADARAMVADPALGTDEKAAILTAADDLESLDKTLSGAREHLAMMLGVENPQTLVLEPSDFTQSAHYTPATDVRGMEELALLNRSELQNKGKLTTAEAESLRAAALKTPGLRDILEDGKPLSPAQWSSFSSNLGKSLTRIFTLPLTIENPAAQDRLAELRQQALSAAILAQVHLAVQSYEAAIDEMNRYESAGSGKQDTQGTLKDMALKTRMGLTAIAARDTYNGLLNTVGLDMLPEKEEAMTVADLSAALKNRFENIAPGVPPEETMIVAASYDIDRQPEIAPAAFHPVDFAMRLPLAEKIFRQDNPSASTFGRFSRTPRTLKVSESGIKTLLDAPITEP